MNPAVRLTGIDKSFGGVHALQGVSLQVEVGTMHAIVGENGAGKTTLMKILYGSIEPDKGAIEIDGHATVFRSTKQAADLGIGMVSQHYGIIPSLTCLENLILGTDGAQFLKTKLLAEQAQSLADSVGFKFDWNADAGTLSPASGQKLEILKLLWRRSKIMILDEPTAMLSPLDADSVFESLGTLVSQGKTVLLVTHRLPEVLQYCSEVTVLRGGRTVTEKRVSETSAQELSTLIIGRSHSAAEGPKAPVGLGSAMVEMAGVSIRDARGRTVLSDVNFELFPGEIVGVAGVDGNGQRELTRVLAGIDRPLAGSLAVFGRRESTAAERIQEGLRMIPEDRHAEGVVDSWSLEENASLELHRLKPVSEGLWFNLRERRAVAERVVARFHTKHGGLQRPISSLSGGNQQRLVAGRSLELDPKLLIAFQPARGLDLGATAEVYRQIREHGSRGMGALVISFDLDELLEHCDRIVVLSDGGLHAVTEPFAKDRDRIGRLMVGAA